MLILNFKKSFKESKMILIEIEKILKSSKNVEKTLYRLILI